MYILFQYIKMNKINGHTSGLVLYFTRKKCMFESTRSAIQAKMHAYEKQLLKENLKKNTSFYFLMLRGIKLMILIDNKASTGIKKYFAKLSPLKEKLSRLNKYTIEACTPSNKPNNNVINADINSISLIGIISVWTPSILKIYLNHCISINPYTYNKYIISNIYLIPLYFSFVQLLSGYSLANTLDLYNSIAVWRFSASLKLSCCQSEDPLICL